MDTSKAAEAQIAFSLNRRKMKHLSQRSAGATFDSWRKRYFGLMPSEGKAAAPDRGG